MGSFSTHPIISVVKCPELGRFVSLETCKVRHGGLPCDRFAFVDWSKKQVVCMTPSPAEPSLQDQAAEAYCQICGEGGGPSGV